MISPSVSPNLPALLTLLWCCISGLVLKITAMDAVDSGNDGQGCVAGKQFLCENGMCIPRSWVCDLENDCFDGTDEINCVYVNCPATHFACSNRRCIPMEWRCDKSDDCGDGTDEYRCDYSTGCGDSDFACNSQHQCIRADQTCDGTVDCLDGSDEDVKCGINECEYPGVYCDALCEDLPIGYRCSCEEGYQLELHNNRSCVDMNECQSQAVYPCEQECINTQGSFRCACDSRWYRLGEDGHSCVELQQSDKDSVSTLLHQRNTVKRLVVQSGVGTVATEYLADSGLAFSCCHNGSWLKVGDNLRQTIGDGMAQDADLMARYDEADRMELWSGSIDSLSSSNLPPIGIKSTNFPSGGIVSKISVDWRTGNLYILTRNGQGISVCDPTMRFCRLLVDDANERSITVNNFALAPLHGYIFIVVFDKNSGGKSLSRSGMDGSQLGGLSGIRMEPDLIEVDELAGKIFIYDTKLNDKLFYMNLDGTDQHQLNLPSRGPFPPLLTALAISAGSLVYADVKSQEILMLDKFSGLNERVLIRGISGVTGLTSIHPWMRTIGYAGSRRTNPCATANCSHLCLLTPIIGSPWCACSTNHEPVHNDVNRCELACPKDTFTCSSDDLCLPKALLCDGQRDCSSGEDEGLLCGGSDSDVHPAATTILPTMLDRGLHSLNSSTRPVLFRRDPPQPIRNSPPFDIDQLKSSSQDCTNLVDAHAWYCTMVRSDVGQTYCQYPGVLSACAYSCCSFTDSSTDT